MTRARTAGPTPVVLFGTGELPRTIMAYLNESGTGQFEVVGFTCDRSFVPEGGEFLGLPVLPFEKQPIDEFAAGFAPERTLKLLLPVGYRDCNRLREQKYHQAKEWGFEFITYVHHSVQRFADVVIGENSIVLDHATIQPGARMGHSCLVWPNAMVGHSASLGDCCWVAGGTVIAGQVSVGDVVFFGTNSTVTNHVAVGNDCIIGVGAVITRDTTDGEVYLSGTNKRHFKKSDKVTI